MPDCAALLQSCRSETVSSDTFQQVWGDTSAPVFLIIYGSLSCSACAELHNNVVEALYQKYGTQGRLCIVMKDYPTDGLSLRASLLAWGVPGKASELRRLFYTNQKTWLEGRAGMPPPSVEESVSILKQLSKKHGIEERTCNDCLKNMDLARKLMHFREKERKIVSLDAVPMIFLLSTVDSVVEKIDADHPVTLNILEDRIDIMLKKRP